MYHISRRSHHPAGEIVNNGTLEGDVVQTSRRHHHQLSHRLSALLIPLATYNVRVYHRCWTESFTDHVLKAFSPTL